MILVFLPDNPARSISKMLNDNGQLATAVSTASDLSEALHCSHYSLAVTTRLNIDVVRAIKPIPVVNLEVYFHFINTADGHLVSSKAFDKPAFFSRIMLLTNQRPSREDAVRDPATGT